MKYLIALLSISVYLTHSVSAQEINIRVVAGNEPVAYAYVYCNGKTVAVTDTLGIVILESISKGDTICATYIGFGRATAIFDGQKDLLLSLSQPDGVILEEVVVRGGKGISKMFKKSDLRWVYH